MKALAVGGAIGGALALASLGAAVALGPEAPDALARWLAPGILATACALILLLRPGNSNGWRAPLGPAAAGLGTLVAIPLAGVLGVEPWLQPVSLALIAAVAASLVPASVGSLELVASAHDAAARAAGDGVLVIDREGRLLHASDSAREALELGSDSEPASAQTPLPAAIQNVLSCELPETVRWESDAGRSFEAWAAPVETRRRGKGVRGVLIRDVTSRRANEKKLVRLANYDSLTGLANRRLFLEYLTQELSDAREQGTYVALFYLDLDQFKSINDTLGHAAGDSLLQGLAGRFRKHLKSQDLARYGMPEDARVQIARLAGDEFALIAPGMTTAKAGAELAGDLLELISKPMSLGDATVNGSGSVGLALFPDDGADVDTLIRHADSALYVAKSRGRKRFARFDPSFEAKADRARLVAVGLEQAIERDELALHYQPKVDLQAGTVVGFEALLRWKNRDLGTVGPSEFIPVAESRGLICPIGAWVMHEAVRQLRAWRDAGLACVPVSVNVSGQQLTETDLQRVVSDALKQYEVDPQLLELELTESMLIDCSEATELCLRDMHAVGIRIALDDFGTGYSALSYLNRFDVDVLKMDRTLLLDIHHNASAAGIAAAVVSMAHSLGLSVVAEGIDTEAQLDPLRQMKCDQVQGFLYAQALPAESAAGFLAPAGSPPVAARPNASVPGSRASRAPVATVEDDADAELPALKEYSDEGDVPALHAPAEPAAHKMLMIDDGHETLGLTALRLNRLGVELHYASEPDEGHLFIAQETDAIRLIAAAPGADMDAMEKLLRSLETQLGSRPPFIVIGEEPDPETRTRIRDAGANWVLWEPYTDTELRYLVSSAMALPSEISQRVLPRVPVDLVATLRAGHRREVAVISSLSARGAFIEMSDPLPLDASLQLEFDVNEQRLRGFGRVIYQILDDPTDPSVVSGVGVAFFGVDRDTTRNLLEAVQQSVARYQP